MGRLPDAARRWLVRYHRVSAYLDPDVERLTLDAVVRAAVAAVDGARWVSVATTHAHGFSTVAASDRTAAAADDLQRRLREGPCLSAALDRTTHHSGDALSDERWPAFGSSVGPLGIRSVFTTRLVDAAPDDATINVYSDVPYAFTSEAQDVTVVLATHAARLITADSGHGAPVPRHVAVQRDDLAEHAVQAVSAQWAVQPREARALLAVIGQKLDRLPRDLGAEYVLAAAEGVADTDPDHAT